MFPWQPKVVGMWLLLQQQQSEQKFREEKHQQLLAMELWHSIPVDNLANIMHGLKSFT